MAKHRSSRQEAVKRIVRSKPIRTQQDLVKELRLMGFSCTQATVSRDIADMGLRKQPDGRYALAEDLHLKQMVAEFVVHVENVSNQVVLKTKQGTASTVAAAIDAAEMCDVLGSLTGSDMVLVISRSAESAHTVTANLSALMQAAE